VVLRNLKLALGAACVTTLAGSGLAAMGAPAALAGTSGPSTYSCSLIGLAVKTQAEALTVTTPASGTTGTSVQVTFTQPGGASTPTAISSITISGTASVSGDSATTILPFTGSIGSVAAGGTIPALNATASLLLPLANGTVTVTLPATYFFSEVFTTGASESGTCTVSGTRAAQGITVAHQPNVTISGITGEVVTSRARAGATVRFSGTSFSANTTVSAALVPAAGGTAIPLPTSPATLTAGSAGGLTGSAGIPSTVAAGAYELTFTDTSGDLPATVPLTILGAPSCAGSPASGTKGTVVTITCTSFDPSASVTVQGVTAAGTATSDPALFLTADPAGAVTAKYTVNAATTAAVSVTETYPGTGISARAAFAAIPAQLQMQQAAPQITLNSITQNGTPQTVTGKLSQITVTDNRASSYGWTLSAVASSFQGANGGAIPASSLRVTPACAPDPAALAVAGVPSFPSTVAAGPAAAMGSTVMLCSTPASGNGAATGGVFDVTGSLSLAVPAYLLAGKYLSTITFSLG
jgi:WxL domain surface cell wall-binding